MAISTVAAATIIVGTFDVASFTGQINSTPDTIGTQDIPNFGSGGFNTRCATIRTGEWGFTGYADFAATTGVSSVFTPTNLGSQYGILHAAPGTATGDPAIFGTARLKALPFGATPTSVGTYALNFDSDGPFAAGWLGAPNASRTTAGYTGASVTQAGPTATQKMYAALNVTAAAGTNLVVKLQSAPASNFASPTDRITFSTVSATGTQLSSAVGAITDGFWRVTATIATGTFSFACAFGVAA